VLILILPFVLSRNQPADTAASGENSGGGSDGDGDDEDETASEDDHLTYEEVTLNQVSTCLLLGTIVFFFNPTPSRGFAISLVPWTQQIRRSAQLLEQLEGSTPLRAG
jgi:hypothetical protein